MTQNQNGEPEAVTLEIITPTALESLERANVDLQISTARRYPRSLSVVKQRMMNLATLDEETAESCFYKLNRQGKAIEGPSIRLAEIAASSFGNLRYGARIIGNDGKTITAQGFCHDLETNVLCTIETQRRITDRNGQTYSPDMQVVTGNAACAIAARNSIFKVVPFAFVKPIYLAAKQTAVGDITTLADRRTKMLTKFAALGVDAKRICASVGKAGVDEIGLDELETLIGVYSGIRDNETTVDEAFPVAPKASDKIAFGDAGIPTPENRGEPPSNAVLEPKENFAPKRKRRTKLEMQAAREGTTTESVATGSKPVVEPPTLATPLQGLRNLINGSPFKEPKEETFVRHLIANMLIEPHQRLQDLGDEKIQEIIDSFMGLASELVDKPPFE